MEEDNLNGYYSEFEVVALAIAVAFTALVLWLVPRRQKRRRPTRQEGIPIERCAAYLGTDMDQWGCPHCGFMLGEEIEEFPPDRPVWGIWHCSNGSCHRQSLIVRDERIVSGVTTIPIYGGMIREIEVIAHPRMGQRSWGKKTYLTILTADAPPPWTAAPPPPKPDPNTGGSQILN